MHRGIVILTQAYPYGTGESFLDAELEFYHSIKLPVLIIPYQSKGDKRPLPETAFVWNPELNFPLACKATFSVLFSKWLWKEIVFHPSQIISSTQRDNFFFFIKTTIKTWCQLMLLYRKNKLKDYSTVCSYWLSGMTMAAIEFRHKNLKVVSRVHGGDLYFHRAPGQYLPARPYLLKNLDHLFTVSNDGAEYLKQKFPWSSAKISVSRLGTFPPKQITAASSDTTLRLVSCSFVNPIKQLNFLVDVLKNYAEIYPQQVVEWTHLGNGPDLNALKAYATKHLDRTRIGARFTGLLSHASVMEFYETHPVDVFLNVSKSEGIPVSIMEAMSAGIPIIAPAVGGIPELLLQIDDGLYDPAATASQVAGLLGKLQPLLKQESFRLRYQQGWRKSFFAPDNYLKFINSILAD